MEKNRYGAASVVVKKDRHVVTWSAQEDELLREQTAIHGTNNWTTISANFNDKISRQCRRRWYTYLNSEYEAPAYNQRAPKETVTMANVSTSSSQSITIGKASSNQAVGDVISRSGPGCESCWQF